MNSIEMMIEMLLMLTLLVVSSFLLVNFLIDLHSKEGGN